MDNPLGAGGGLFPLSGSNRDGLSVAGDAVWVMSDRTTVNVRGSDYNMVDEFYNPSLLLGSEGLASNWPNDWYGSLYNSGYVYYPALDVISGTGAAPATGSGGRAASGTTQAAAAFHVGGGGNFGKVTRKRTDSYGREIQIGVRFVF